MNSNYLESHGGLVGRALSSGPKSLGSRLAWRNIACTLMAGRWNVLEVPIQNYTSRVSPVEDQNCDDKSPDHP